MKKYILGIVLMFMILINFSSHITFSYSEFYDLLIDDKYKQENKVSDDLFINDKYKQENKASDDAKQILNQLSEENKAKEQAQKKNEGSRKEELNKGQEIGIEIVENNKKKLEKEAADKVAEAKKEEERVKQDEILKQEKVQSTSLTGIFDSGDEFISKGESDQIGTINQDKLKEGVGILYNIFVSIGVFVAIVVGIILGIKIMAAASADEKAEYKKLIIVYVVGCVVVFGAFGIWKIVVDTLTKAI